MGKRPRGGKRKRRSVNSFRSKLLREVEPNIATLEAGNTATSDLGKCSYQYVCGGKSPFDLYTISAFGAPFADLRTLGNQDARWHIKSWARTEIINSTTLPTNITFYTCVPRYNINRSIYNAILGAAQSNVTQPTIDTYGLAAYNTSTDYTSTNRSWLSTSLAQYDAKNNAAGGSYALHQVPSVTPFDSPSFCRLFKITSVKHACVNPGKCFSLVIKRPYRRFDPLTNNIIITSTGGILWFKGEPFVIMKLMGGPVHDTADHTTSAPSATRVTYIQQKKYWIKFMSQADRAIAPVLQFATSFAGNPEVVQQPAAVVQTGPTNP